MVFIDFTVYNVNLNHWCVIRQTFEFSAAGGVKPNSFYTVTKIMRYVYFTPRYPNMIVGIIMTWCIIKVDIVYNYLQCRSIYYFLDTKKNWIILFLGQKYFFWCSLFSTQLKRQLKLELWESNILREFIITLIIFP